MTERCIVCVDDERIVLSSLKDQLRGHFGGAFTVEFSSQCSRQAASMQSRFVL